MPSTSTRLSTRRPQRHLIALLLAVAIAAGIGASVRPAHAAEAPVDLGTAGSFGALAGSTVTNTGSTQVKGNVGVSAGSAIIGFPPGIATGTFHAADSRADGAQADLTAAYTDAAGRTPTTSTPDSEDLGGQSLTPGVYSYGDIAVTGDLTLIGDASSVWIFQAGSTLITASDSRVLLTDGVDPCNVFWQIGTSATLGTDSTMVGTVMAQVSITATTEATVTGRLLARTGAVTLDTTAVAGPLSCGTSALPVPPVPPVAPAPPAAPAVPVPGDATFVG